MTSKSEFDQAFSAEEVIQSFSTGSVRIYERARKGENKKETELVFGIVGEGLREMKKLEAKLLLARITHTHPHTPDTTHTAQIAQALRRLFGDCAPTVHPPRRLHAHMYTHIQRAHI